MLISGIEAGFIVVRSLHITAMSTLGAGNLLLQLLRNNIPLQEL